MPLAALALLLAADPASAGRFGVPDGVPPGPASGDPGGYLLLVGSEAVDGAVSAALGDVAGFMTFAIEVGDPTQPLVVEIYDPGLHDPALGAGQLDGDLDPGGSGGSMRYVLYGPDPADGTPDTVLASPTFGADTAGTDRQLVEIYRDDTPRPGLYHLVAELDEVLTSSQALSAFGLRVAGHQVSTLNLTAGHVNEGLAGDATQGGATIAEPITLHPWVARVSAGSDVLGPVCGLQFVSYDMEAATNGFEPPTTTLETPSGFVFPAGQVPPSGDARWFATNLGGIEPGALDSSDHGTWTWRVSDLGGADLEDAFSNLDPPIDFNAFSVQVLDHGTGPRDFMNWPDVPNRAPFFVFNPDDPRRIYLPMDSGSAPRRATLNHAAVVVDGFPVVANGETSTLEVTVVVDNPHPFALTGLVGETHVAPDAAITDPVVTAFNGLAATVAGRRIDFSGDVPAGTSASFSYRVDLTPPDLGRGFLTGDGVDFVSAGSAPTIATWSTPYTDPLDVARPMEVFGPVCQLEYDAVVPPCAVDATIVASEPLQTCPGTEVVLDGSTSEVFNCEDVGGIAIFQWSANGSVVEPFPGPESVTVTPFANDTWTLEVACSTDPDDCRGEDAVTFELYEAPAIDAGADVTACAGGSVTLAATATTANPPVDGWLWTTDPPGEDGDGATGDTITVTPSETTTYTASATDAQGCRGEDEVVVTVAAPAPTIAPDTPELCPGESVELVVETGFASYSWTTDPPGLPGDGATTESVTTDRVGTWTVTVTDENGCSGAASATVSVAPPLSPTITPDPPELCGGGTLGLVGEPGFVEYAWTTDPPGASGDGATTPNVVADAIGVTYTLSVTDARGCTGSSSVTTAERAPFMPTIAPAAPEVCPGSPVELVAEDGFVTYLWTTDPPGLPGDGATTRRLTTDQVGTYTVEVVDAQNCTGTASVEVTASADPIPGPLGPSLRVAKQAAIDLRLSWTDLPDPASGYEIVSLDCDQDGDGTCDVDPDDSTLRTGPTATAVEPVGAEEHVEAGGLQRSSWLVFYKVRALSPCSATPGPFL